MRARYGGQTGVGAPPRQRRKQRHGLRGLWVLAAAATLGFALRHAAAPGRQGMPGSVCLCLAAANGSSTVCTQLSVNDDRGNMPSLADAQPELLEGDVTQRHVHEAFSEVMPQYVGKEPAPEPVTRYRLHVAGGAPRSAGELHAQAEGVANQLWPHDWMVQYLRRWHRKLKGGWEPLLRVRISPASQKTLFRCSKALLRAPSREDHQGTRFGRASRKTALRASPVEAGIDADGSGLDLHLETSAERVWSGLPQQYGDAELVGVFDEDRARVVLRQKAELSVGPVAQQRFFNVTLPVGMLLGAELRSSGESDAEGATNVGPLSFYVRAHTPGIQEIRGWFGKVELDDPWVGLIRGELQQPWPRDRGKTSWILEHLRTHTALKWPVAVIENLVSSGGVLKDALGLYPGGPTPAVVPSTRLRAGSAGAGAAMAVQSSQTGLGRPAWGGSIDVNRAGWGGGLRFIAGSKDNRWGQPGYSVAATAPWGSKVRFTHEFKYLLSDGQGVWARLQSGKKGPRLNVGLEVR